MRRSAAGPHACWACLSRRLQPLGLPSLVPVSRGFRASALRARDATPALRRDFATVQDLPGQGLPGDTVQPIRKRLRQWEAENKHIAPKGIPADDHGGVGRPRNLLTRARGKDDVALSSDELGLDDQPVADSDGALDQLPTPTDYQTGDLIEMHENGDRIALLAICLGYFHGTYHFYTAAGKWHPAQRLTSHFVYRNFVTDKELEPLIDMLPKKPMSQLEMKEMRDLNQGPDRVSGAALVRKMAKFQNFSETVLQKQATRFESAHKILVKGAERYLTLDEIAIRLLGMTGRPSPIKTAFNPATLYAVHRTILSDSVGFRLVGSLGNSRTWLYEVTSSEDVALINNMQALVRLFTDIPGKEDTPLSALTPSQMDQSQIGRFILRARKAVDHSRKSREWTPYGVLGPEKKSTAPITIKWSDVDLSILHFMHLWAGCDHFPPSSPIHWIGSAILRGMGRYKDSEYLSTATGWTFLQEVGYITPWDLHTRYTQPLPGVKTSRDGGFARIPLGPGGVSAYLTPDPFINSRKEWTDHRVFAIDSKDTTDIDDAISIEATETPGEHWIHVHSADPASRIRPESALGERAKLVPLNLYLSGHYSNIWGLGDEVQELFSLGPNKPCLTFSGKVNEQGELLEYKITPGKLHDYIYMTPEEVNIAVGYEDLRQPPAWSTTRSFKVGQPPAEKADNRKMTTAAELEPEALEQLKILRRLTDAIKQRRLDKGAMPLFSLRPQAKASFPEASTEPAPRGFVNSNGDPFISISWDATEAPIVTNTMTLAGEIAARWCQERDIPIPFVSQPSAAKNIEVLRPYAKNLYSKLLRGEEPTPEQSSTLRQLIGTDATSTKPGSHFLMGLDCYAKVTSPLRRYTDLVAHWQIEGALEQEAEAEAGGKKAAAARLPFSRAQLDKKVLPWVRFRQGIIRRLGGFAGTQAYMLQALVRAWRFPAEGDSQLPATFRFKANHFAGNQAGPVVVGTLDWFGLPVRMIADGLGALGVRVADVSAGDIFEVKLSDVNVHGADVFVEAVAKIKFQGDDAPAPVAELPAAEAQAEQVLI